MPLAMSFHPTLMKAYEELVFILRVTQISLVRLTYIRIFSAVALRLAQSRKVCRPSHIEKKLPPEAMVEVLASAAEAAVKATNYLGRSIPDS